ncbi:MAG TPA: SsrA-binding protein SmpB [Candidatus Bathyarchaeia archaeon]|nr:SsrA-binding protein SmpB [Candidatus Bathyarchaeia archaeon]
MSKPIATNKKAYHNFFLSDHWECGIALSGGEVKSIRAGLVNFKNSFARVEEGEVFLYDLDIMPYKEASFLQDKPDRRRKLLLHKKEIAKIDSKVREGGCALLPTKLYFTERGLIKVEIVLGKSKKVYDKRETIKKRTVDLGMKRMLKARR